MDADIDALPNELLGLIFSFVACIDLAWGVAPACHRWRERVGDIRATGRTLCMHVNPWKSDSARPSGHSLDESLALCAAAAGHTTCMRRLSEQNHVFSTETATMAARHGHLDALDFAHRHGARLSAWCLSDAAAGGHLDCIAYLHGHGCPSDERPCSNAAAGGHIGCLAYLHEHGCLWDGDTITDATENGHIDCLRYAIEKGVSMGHRPPVLGHLQR